MARGASHKKRFRWVALGACFKTRLGRGRLVWSPASRRFGPGPPEGGTPNRILKHALRFTDGSVRSAGMLACCTAAVPPTFSLLRRGCLRAGKSQRVPARDTKPTKSRRYSRLKVCATNCGATGGFQPKFAGFQGAEHFVGGQQPA